MTIRLPSVDTLLSRAGDLLYRMTHRIPDATDLFLSRFENEDGPKSVCLMLGPYRNLSTLTAAILFLHPNCQVLNHAGGRIFGRKQVDFISDFKPAIFDRFVRYAIRISVKGRRGNYGGSILHAHAFDPTYELRTVFDSTGLHPLKQDIDCLFWKEPLRTANWIRNRGADLSRILDAEPKLRFLMPIRNPVDCALSNLKTGHARLFENLSEGASDLGVLEAILDEFLWFAALQRQFPGRFFHYFEHEISREMLESLAEFLDLDADDAWIEQAVSAMTIVSRYERSGPLDKRLREIVDDKFGEFPELSAGLLKFCDA